MSKPSLAARSRRIKLGVVVLLAALLVIPLIPYAWATLVDQGVIHPGGGLWHEIRKNTLEGATQAQGVDNHVLINDRGEQWRLFRLQRLVPYGAYLIGGMLVGIILWYSLRGRIRIEAGRSGVKVPRFTHTDRVVHWFTATLFLFLALTGLVLLYGKFILVPLLGKEGFAPIASACKEAHNLFGPLFLGAIVALVITFVRGNFPHWVDLKWVWRGGGLLGVHASCGRYNIGEKFWFWAAGLLGLAIALTGLVLDFPVFGQGRLWMEGAHVIHTSAGLIMLALLLSHIYIGTLGMEGAFDGMATGYVDAAWAREHHDLWYEHLIEQGVVPQGAPPPLAHEEQFKEAAPTSTATSRTAS